MIRATIERGNATSGIQGLALSGQFCFRDLDAVIAQLPEAPHLRTVPVPSGTEPGFLFAMASLMRQNVEAARHRGVVAAGARRSYVDGSRLYPLLTKSSRVLRQVTFKGRTFRHVVDTEFEARRAGGPGGPSFRVMDGTEGAPTGRSG